MRYVIAIVLVLGGCATSTQMQGPDGKQAHFIRCGSAVLDACYKEAAKVCPGGYTVVDNREGANAVVTTVGTTSGIVRGLNTMFVQCKAT
jgi:hypothetical protein